MNPVVNGLQKEYDGKVTFDLVDIDLPDSRSLMQQYGFRAQPYFVLLDREGTVAQTWYGIVPEDAFREAFEALIAD